MMLTLVAIAVMAPSAELTILTDKEVYAPGETVRVDFLLHNRGEQSFTVATTRWDGLLSARMRSELLSGDKQYWPALDATHSPAVQVRTFNEVTSDRFSEVYPKQKTNVGWYEFKAAASERHSGLKADPRPEPKPLAPGVYELRATYKFVGPFDQYQFTPSARAKFDRAFKGELKATKTFRVAR
jgi:hypothetical protein